LDSKKLTPEMQETMEKPRAVSKGITPELLKEAWKLMCTAKAMSEIYEANKEITAKYVHATSRGHEAVQIALGLQLLRKII